MVDGTNDFETLPIEILSGTDPIPYRSIHHFVIKPHTDPSKRLL